MSTAVAEAPATQATPEQPATFQPSDELKQALNQVFDDGQDENDPEFDTPDTPHRAEPAAESQDDGAQAPADNTQQQQADDGFDAALLDAAGAIGFSKDDFPSAAAMEKAVLAFDQRLLSLSQQGPEHREQPAPQQRVDAQSAAQQPQGDETGEFQLKLDKDAFDPEIVQAFEGLHGHYQGRLSQMEQALGALLEQHQQQQAAQVSAECDRFFESLGESYHEILGKGAIGDFKPDSEAFKNRSRVVLEAKALIDAYAQAGLPVKSLDTFLHKALRSAFSDKVDQANRKQISTQLRDRKGQFIARPTSAGKRDLPTGEKRAIGSVSTFMREHPELFAGADEEEHAAFL